MGKYMDYCEFTNETTVRFSEDIFEEAKEVLLGEYLSFSIIPDSEVTKEILSEKICDYFEKMEIKTGKSFDKQINLYIKALDSIVSGRIEEPPVRKKKDTSQVVISRAKKYYEKADSIKSTRSWKVRNLIDYTRIMMCLYMAIIENKYKQIENLNLAVECLKPRSIIASMKNELDPGKINLTKKKLFNIKDLYCSDTCTFIITIILLYTILNEKVQGEYNYE